MADAPSPEVLAEPTASGKSHLRSHAIQAAVAIAALVLLL